MASMVGMCTLVSGEADSGLERTIRLCLTPECLTVQEEVKQAGSTNQFDQSGLPVLREISLCRDHRGSFGFSVRGGSENRLPVLVSHVQKGMPAFKTKALFVGDAILRIDQASVEGATHDEVVERLKNAGQQVTLVVKHFREAAKLLHDQLQSSSSSNSSAARGGGGGGGRGANNRRRASSSAVSGSVDGDSSSTTTAAVASTATPGHRQSGESPLAVVLASVSSRDNLLASSGDAIVDFSGCGVHVVGGGVCGADTNEDEAEDPWVPRAAAAVSAAARKAPLASESFSTFRSSSSAGSAQLQQPQPQQQLQQQQQQQQPLIQRQPPQSSSDDSSKISLLPQTSTSTASATDAAQCTVFANRNADRAKKRSQLGGNSSTLSDSMSQQQLQKPSHRSWLDVMTVPLKYGRVTRYQPNSDQLRRHSFEVVGLNGHSTGCLTFSSYEDFTKWYTDVHNNIRLLMEAEVSSFNARIGIDFPPKTEPLIHMGWLGLTLHDSPQMSRLWQDVFLALRGDDLLLFEVPPIFLDDWRSASVKEKVYKCVIRVLDDEELLDKRLNSFFLHCGSSHTFYMSAETVSEVSRLERCWFRATSNSLAKKSANASPVVFKVTHNGEDGQLTFDLDKGISFSVGQRSVWAYKFSCLKRSYDDRDRTLFLHFQDGGLTDVGSPAVKEVQVTDLQLLLIVLHSFLSSKLTAVDPQFLKR